MSSRRLPVSAFALQIVSDQYQIRLPPERRVEEHPRTKQIGDALALDQLSREEH